VSGAEAWDRLLRIFGFHRDAGNIGDGIAPTPWGRRRCGDHRRRWTQRAAHAGGG
jgi:hypothetical protein